MWIYDLYSSWRATWCLDRAALMPFLILGGIKWWLFETAILILRHLHAACGTTQLSSAQLAQSNSKNDNGRYSSPLLVVQWGRWVAFWKALELLYRSRGVWRPNIDFLPIVLVRKGVRKPSAAWKSSWQPDFHSIGPNLTKIQHDHR